ncbi:hypothetical protein [Kribbella sp. NPDC048915]|uniref:hypothetical protein n=1 Tax=Kribbella sp. NPDC048915 TaxID=3155148 RepID=UPI0033C28C6E
MAVLGFVVYQKAVAVKPAIGDTAEATPLVTSGLPTADETVFLELSATVHWRTGKPRSYHPDLARALVLLQAREVTSKWRPAQYSLAQHELAARVGRPQPEASGELEVWATEVRLELPEAVQQHLAKMDEAQRRGLLWEVDTLNETKIRTYLREDALRTPASAMVWWLARNQESVEQAVGLAGVLTKLSQFANGRNEADDSAEAQLLIDAVRKLDASTRRPTAHGLAEALDQADLPDLARALREEFNLPALRQIVDLRAAPERDTASSGLAGEP